MRSVLLMSGGLDSAVILAGLSQFSEVTCLAVNYGQRHNLELECAETLATHYEAKCIEMRIDMGFLRTPLLSNQRIEARTPEQIRKTRLSPMIVPARNSILLSLGLALAEEIEAEDVLIGSTADDHAFPDCRPEFIEAFGQVAKQGTVRKPKILAPLVKEFKAHVAREAVRMDIPIAKTCSCYQPRGFGISGFVIHCGECDACVMRRTAFTECGLHDPTVYEKAGR